MTLQPTLTFFAQPTCHVALFPPFPPSHCPRKAGYSDSFLSSPQQSPVCSRCSLPSTSPLANEYFIVSSGQKVLGSAAVRGLANDKLGFSPCRTGGVIMDRGSQSWISEIHGTCIA